MIAKAINAVEGSAVAFPQVRICDHSCDRKDACYGFLEKMIVWGIDSTELDSVASAIGRALHVEFQPHESDFRGGPHCRAEVAEGVIMIQRNLDVLDSKPFEANWPSDKLVLYMDGMSDDCWGSYLDALRAVRDPKATELR